ncbi:hypothetical protein QQP08_017411 [Theobroma cacao]|nr:hypothetical protein QQP08_017411 [Theobroma cacao]
MPKAKEEWTKAEMRKVHINFNAINTLRYALTPVEFNKISRISQVKESKITFFTHNYDMFKVELGEDISTMFDRFTNITNKLNQLGKPIPEHELVKRLLRSLRKS